MFYKHVLLVFYRYSVLLPDLFQENFENMGVKIRLGSGGVYTVYLSGDDKKVGN